MLKERWNALFSSQLIILGQQIFNVHGLQNPNKHLVAN